MADNKVIVFAVVALLVGVAAGAGIGYAVFHDKNSSDETYYFYLFWGDNDAKNGWYSASAGNADDALDKAMKKADIPVDWTTGYPCFDSSSWYSAYYIYGDTTKLAAEKSVKDPVDDAWGMGMFRSNGWVSFIGYDETEDPADLEKKLHEAGSNIFFFCPYSSSWVAISSPAAHTAWMTAEGTPFSA
jgi:hypothetical protein